MPLLTSSRDADGIVLTWDLARPAAEVWQHLTSRQHLPHWLGQLVSGTLDEGRTVVVDHGEGYLCTSLVDRVEPGRALGMSWDFPDEPTSHLRVTLEASDVEEPAEPSEHPTEPTARGCRLTLRHTGLGDLGTSYLPGWITHLTFFEASLAGTHLPPEAFWPLCATLQTLTPR